MKKLYVVLLFAAALLSSHSAFSQQQADTADSIKSWLNFLASDKMKGRANGSPEIEQVAEWLSAKYAQYGLHPADRLNGFAQSYTLYGDSSFIHKNILGYIPAKNQTDNDSAFIILSAHFDHIGMTRYPVDGDSIYNGADDNASGIVMLLAIAKNLYDRKAQPDCPIVFASFSNEEKGLWGSWYFCKSGVIPVQKVKININFEMLGHSEEFGKNRYYITGPGYSNFQDIVADFNKERTCKLANAGEVVNSLFQMADNYSFVANISHVCIPAHTIATSLGFKHIHRVSDEVRYVDFENMSNLADNLTQLVMHVADKAVAIKCK